MHFAESKKVILSNKTMLSLLAILLMVGLTISAIAQKNTGPRRPLPKPASGPRGFDQTTGRDASTRLIAAAATRGPLSPLAPLEGLAYEDRPMFVWEEAPGVRSYHFVLRQGVSSTDQVLFETDVTEPRLSYPETAPALTPGKVYLWRVSTAGVLERKSGTPVTFFVLAGSDAEAVKRALRKEKLLTPASASERLRQARVFAQFGVWYDALRIATELTTQDQSDTQSKAFLDEIVARLAKEQKEID